MHDVRAADLDLFLAILEAGTLTRAAAVLGVDQGTVSRRLAELEERLGAALFVRAREGVHLTPLGTAWEGPARAARLAVLQARRASSRAAGGVTGLVRIAASAEVADHFLVPALPELLARHPELDVDLLVADTLADLTRLEADVAVRFVRPASRDLVARRLHRMRFGAFATQGLAAALGGIPLAQWPWIGWPEQAGPQSRWMAARGVRLRLRGSTSSSHLAAARRGVAVAILPVRLAQAFAELVPVPVEGLETMGLEMFLVAHAEQRRIPRVDAAWRWLATALSADGTR